VEPVVLVICAMALLHRADGGAVAVAPGQVTALHGKAPANVANKAVTSEARCIVWLADGKLLSVLEPCDVVRRLLEEAKC
jgi:hypothetical protein